MVFVLVQGSDAFLQGQQALVDLRSVNPSLLLQLVCMVSGSLAASQVDKRYFAMKLILLFQANLKNGV